MRPWYFVSAGMLLATIAAITYLVFKVRQGYKE